MKKSPKNYIYFKGGSWGDITGLIVNNNVRIDRSVLRLLKCQITRETPVAPEIDKSILDSLPVETLVGHNLNILKYGYKNFKIVISDERIRKIASERFASASNMNDISHVVAQYYPQKLYDTIAKLPLNKQISLLSKKYERQVDMDATPLDLSCIFDKQKYLDMLSNHFNFDNKVASKTYDDWRDNGNKTFGLHGNYWTK